MLPVLQAALLCICSAVLCVLLRSFRPEFSFFAGCAAVLCLLLSAMPDLRDIADGISRISIKGELSETAAQCIRAASVVLLCEISASVCKDAGQSALAAQIELWGRITLCAMCVPVFAALIDSLSSLSFLS